jgi:glycerol-3-phosphate acyltransferase PlsY
MQFAYFISRVKGIDDIREHGSGNAGMTNVSRVLGFKVGGLVFALDILKAVAAFLVARYLFGDGFYGLCAGLGAMLGHNFPFFMRFKGGKGASCMIGIIIVYSWQVSIVCFLIPLVFLLATRHVSAGSLAVAAVFPLSMIFFRYTFEFGAEFGYGAIGIAFAICALCWFKHWDNIKRIINGTERKIGFSKSKR